MKFLLASAILGNLLISQLIYSAHNDPLRFDENNFKQKDNNVAFSVNLDDFLNATSFDSDGNDSFASSVSALDKASKEEEISEKEKEKEKAIKACAEKYNLSAEEVRKGLKTGDFIIHKPTPLYIYNLEGEEIRNPKHPKWSFYYSRVKGGSTRTKFTIIGGKVKSTETVQNPQKRCKAALENR